MKKYLSIYFHVLALVCILFFPFEFHFFPFQQNIVKVLFKSFTDFIHQLLYHQPILSFELISDSSVLYSLLFVLILLSVIISSIVIFLPQINYKNTTEIIKKISAIYIALILFKYGVFKLFQTQFYTPEPNILFTPLGFLDKDILYWSTMGTSYSYNLFMGIVEITASILILFNKTRVLGLLISLGTIINILAVNIGFNISVKAFAFFLLFLNLLLLSENIKNLFVFFVFGKSAKLNQSQISNINSKYYTAIKTFIVLMVLLESFYPQISNFFSKQNETKASAVYELVNRNDSVAKQDIKRLFIHSHHFLILQFQNDSMQDYKLAIDTLQKQFIIQDYSNKIFKLDYKKYTSDSLIIQLPGMDYQRFKAIDLPVIK